MPNRTIPEFWINDLILNSLSPKAELLFRKIYHKIDDSHRFEIGPSPARPLVLHAALYALRPNQRQTDTARDLQELQNAGVISLRDSERGWYGEIAERLRYRAEDFAKGAPRFGPREAHLPAQAELKLGPVGPVPAALKSPAKSRAYEYEDGNDSDSKTRELSRGMESPGKSPSRFASDEGAIDDEAWGDIARALGGKEMVANGKLWERRFKLCRRALVTAFSQWQCLPPEERVKGNAGAFMTAVFEQENKRAG